MTDYEVEDARAALRYLKARSDADPCGAELQPALCAPAFGRRFAWGIPSGHFGEGPITGLPPSRRAGGFTQDCHVNAAGLNVKDFTVAIAEILDFRGCGTHGVEWRRNFERSACLN